MGKVVLIQSQLLLDLEVGLKEYNKVHKPKLKLDVAVFYLSLFNSVPSYIREEVVEEINEREVSLSSKRLKWYNDNYKSYFDYFLNNDLIIHKSNYGADINRCNGYSLSSNYFNDDVIPYEIMDKVFSKKFDKKLGLEVLGKYKFYQTYAERNRGHLTRSFNERLIIDKNEAFSIAKALKQSNYYSYTNAKQLINEFANNQWRYSIKTETDNRLHTNLTRLNKKLKRCLKYDNEYLSAVDIGCSQPYFFCVFLQGLLDRNKELFDCLGITDLVGETEIKELINLIDRAEVESFVSLITECDFYEDFGKKINVKYDEFGTIYRMSKIKNKRGKKKRGLFKECFKTKRDYAKNAIMRVFFSQNNKSEDFKCFQKSYYNISCVMGFIKQYCLPFHSLLSNIEAKCLLDVVAKDFCVKYPEIPLWSIHDSLVTTEKNIDLLYKEVKVRMNDLTGIEVTLKKEYWGNIK